MKTDTTNQLARTDPDHFRFLDTCSERRYRRRPLYISIAGVLLYLPLAALLVLSVSLVSAVEPMYRARPDSFALFALYIRTSYLFEKAHHLMVFFWPEPPVW